MFYLPIRCIDGEHRVNVTVEQQRQRFVLIKCGRFHNVFVLLIDTLNRIAQVMISVIQQVSRRVQSPLPWAAQGVIRTGFVVQ